MLAHAKDAAGNAGPGAAIETVVPANIATPYLKVRLELRGGRVVIGWDRALLGVLPMGPARISARLPAPISIRVATVLRIERLVAAGVLVAAAATLALPIAAEVLMVAFAVWLLPLSVIKAIRVDRAGMRRRIVPICWFHTVDAELFAAAVEAEREGARKGPM